MPKTDDKKPRAKKERAARAAVRKATFIGPRKPKSIVMTLRQLSRRALWRQTQEIIKAQTQLEQQLRKVGVSWRRLEKAVAALAEGKWASVDPAFMKAFLEQEGVRFDQVEEQAA